MFYRPTCLPRKCSKTAEESHTLASFMTLQSNSPKLIAPLGSRECRGIEAWRDRFTGILFKLDCGQSLFCSENRGEWNKETEVRAKLRLCLRSSADFTTATATITHCNSITDSITYTYTSFTTQIKKLLLTKKIIKTESRNFEQLSSKKGDCSQ